MYTHTTWTDRFNDSHDTKNKPHTLPQYPHPHVHIKTKKQDLAALCWGLTEMDALLPNTKKTTAGCVVYACM